jgi:hypothetical protein
MGIALLAQGVLLPVLSLQLGSMSLAWIGLAMFMVGLSLSFFYATQGQVAMYDASAPQPNEEDKEAERERIERVLTKLNLPVCITDSRGEVIGGTPLFYEVTGKVWEDVEGELVSGVIPIDDEEMTLPSGKWYVTQAKEGERYYFILSPTPDGKPAPEAKSISAPQDLDGFGLSGIFDKATGLFTDEYRKMRGPEEISRAQRYKRMISGMLLELYFTPLGDVQITEQQQKMLKNAFAMRVKAALRTMDLGFLTGDYRIQILLPETPQTGAKTLVSRMLTLPRDVFDDEIRSALNPKVKAGMYTYGGTTRMEYAAFCATLEQAFASAKEGAAGTVTTPVAAPSQAA